MENFASWQQMLVVFAALVVSIVSLAIITDRCAVRLERWLEQRKNKSTFTNR